MVDSSQIPTRNAQLTSYSNVSPITGNSSNTSQSSKSLSSGTGLQDAQVLLLFLQLLLGLIEQISSGDQQDQDSDQKGAQKDSFNGGSAWAGSDLPEPPPVSNTDDMYAQRFREAVINNVNQIGDGWDFFEGVNLVNIQGGELVPPELRQYTAQGSFWSLETVLERNEFWEVVERDGRRMMLMRETDNQGHPVRPSDALNDIFQNPDKYAFDCSTPMPLINMKATMDVIGEDDFNRNVDRLAFSGWKDPVQNDFDGGYNTTSRFAAAGDVTVNGVSNLAGEASMYDPEKDGPLEVGNVYYFERPGDRSSDQQGWNAIYMGTDPNGNHKFWTPSVGVVDVQFEDNSWVAKVGFDDYYLGAINSSPNTARLAELDSDGSGLA